MLKKLKFQNHLKFDPDVVQHQSTRRLKARIRFFLVLKNLLTIGQHLLTKYVIEYQKVNLELQLGHVRFKLDIFGQQVLTKS